MGHGKFNGKKSFQFDKVYEESSKNQEIYETSVKPMLDSIFQGFNATIFAYGITGSGKTHTMFGRLALLKATPSASSKKT